MDAFIKKYTEQYTSKEYWIQKKAEYTLFAFVLIGIYVLTGILLMKFGRQAGAMYVASIAVVCLILIVTWVVFVRGHLLLSQHILLGAGIVAIFSHLFMQLNFHFYVQILFVLIVGYVIHISKVQLLVIVTSLVSLMVGRSVFLYHQSIMDERNVILFKQNIFIVASIMMIMIFVHYFNRIITSEIIETHQLSKSANIDILTGLLCRKKFNQDMVILDSALKTYCLAVIDIDHFKVVNDRCGHDGGDIVLIKLSKMITDTFINEGVFRWGGEEFVVVMETAQIDSFMEALEGLRIKVMRSQLIEDGVITISIGVSQKKNDQTYANVFAQADHALFVAKKSGRNQTVFEGVKL